MISASSRKTCLDGLRAFAIILIVASHCGFLGQGGVGNCFFFALSGFLIMRPFSDVYKFEFDSLNKTVKYYRNRIIRIIPVFWLTLFLATMFRQFYNLSDFDSYYNLFLNMFFIKSMGHLWFLQQEMLFYLIYPILGIAIFFLNRILSHAKMTPFQKNLFLAIILIAVSLIYKRYWMDIIHLYGNGKQQPFRLEQFLMGMGAAAVYKALKLTKPKFPGELFRWAGKVYVFLFLIGCILSSHEILRLYNPDWDTLNVGWHYTLYITTGVCLIILILLFFPNEAAAKFLGCRCLAYIGKLSYIIYLIHWYFLDCFRQDNHVTFFLAVLSVSICCAAMLHVLVEIPCLIFSRDYKINSLANYYKHLKLEPKY